MKRRMILVMILLMIGLYFLTMFISTNELMRFAKSVFRGTYDRSCETNMVLQRRYDMTSYFPKESIGSIELSLRRVFVAHDFSNGYIWVRYTCIYQDHDDKEVSASRGVYSKWKIQKRNGVWEVTEIFENP